MNTPKGKKRAPNSKSGQGLRIRAKTSGRLVLHEHGVDVASLGKKLWNFNTDVRLQEWLELRNQANVVNRAQQNLPNGQYSFHVVRQLPTIFAIGLVGLNRRDRDEVLADFQEWYQEIAETRGTGWAKLFVFMKLVSAFGGQILSVAERVAGIIGKVRAQK